MAITDFKRIVGHRGAAGVAPENTLGGIRKAYELGVRKVEIDVSLSADGVLMVIHDASIDRCCAERGVVNEMTAKQLSEVNASVLFEGWPAEPVPTLAEALALLGELKMDLILEVKDHSLPIQPLAQAVVNTLAAHFPDAGRTVVSSFQPDILRRIKAINPAIRLGLIFEFIPDDWQTLANELSPTVVYCNWQLLNYVKARSVVAAGIPLSCWTANEPEAIESLWQWGVDEVITNDPEKWCL